MDLNTKIDGYKAERKLKKGTKEYEIVVEFFSHHKVCFTKKYEDVGMIKLNEIKEKLFHLTEHNLNESEISRVIPFTTILGEIERIIFGK